MSIKWGILGTGKIANRLAQDLLLVEGAQLYAIASRSIEKAKRFGQQYNAKKCYASYEALANDPNIDVVYIATPHVFHFENTMLCLKAEKSVLCEKPFGMNRMQVSTMIETAKNNNVFLMEAMWTRFIPATEKVLELIESDAIGKIKDVRADFGFKANFDPNGRLFNKALGGGSLLDIGIYPIYLSLLLLGKPQTIKTIARMSSTGVDSTLAMLFGYENGQTAVLDSNIEADTPIEACIYGTKGVLKIHRRFHHATQVSLIVEDKVNSFELPYVGNGYYHEALEVTNCLRDGVKENAKIPHATSLDLISVLDDIRKDIGLVYEQDI